MKLTLNTDIKDLARSQTFRGVLIGVTAAIVVLVIFQAGMFVGFRKASFAYRHGDNYYRAFEGHRRGVHGMGTFEEMMGAHGAAGKIVSISLPTFMIEGRDGTEKVVLVKDDTIVRRFRDEIASAELVVNDFVVVIGTLNDQAQVEAQLIRVLPPPSYPDMMKEGTSTKVK